MLHCFSFMTIVLCSLVFVFFSFVSRNCIALHSCISFSVFFLYNKKIKINKNKNKKKERKERKRKHIVVLALFSLFLKIRLVNLFSPDMSIVLCLALMSLFIALDWLKLCSACCVGKMFMVFITLS